MYCARQNPGDCDTAYAAYAVAGDATTMKPLRTLQTFAPLDEPEPQAPRHPPRASLFGIVTGAIRRTLPAGAAAAEDPAGRQDPAAHAQPEPPRASVRLAAGDEMGLDIPAFLRRQSS